jgi:hypothetical protein
LSILQKFIFDVRKIFTFFSNPKHVLKKKLSSRMFDLELCGGTYSGPANEEPKTARTRLEKTFANVLEKKVFFGEEFCCRCLNDDRIPTPPPPKKPPFF